MSLKLDLLGQPCVHLDEADLTSQIGHKSLAVLAFLALEQAPLAREKLAGTFWSDKAEQAALYRLRHTLWELRRLLGDKYIGSDNAQCWIEHDRGVRVDVLEFERGCHTLGIDATRCAPRAEQVPAIAALVAMCRGDLLAGIVAQDAPLFDEWLLVERERLQLLEQQARWCLALAQQAAQDDTGAAQTLTRLIQIDPLRERNYRALMNLRARQDDRAGALRVYAQCAQTLMNELGIAPSAETQRLRERIARGTPDPTGMELERAIAQAEIALAEGKADQARTLLRSARQVVQNLFR